MRQENINAVEYFYDVVFDDPFEGGNSIEGIVEKSVFKVRKSVLINISFGLGEKIQTEQKIYSIYFNIILC